jgi:hypothetical protein
MALEGSPINATVSAILEASSGPDTDTERDPWKYIGTIGGEGLCSRSNNDAGSLFFRW